MKKYFKGLALACLAIIMFCPLIFAGCSKNYTIKISIASGEGQVYKKDVNGISVLGNNTVKKGEKFEFFIEPASGYIISKIVIDGEEYDKSFTQDGCYLSFEDVDRNHNVEITFAFEEWTLNFMCLDDTTGTQVLYKQVSVTINSAVNLNNAEYGGENNKLWYTIDTTQGAETRVVYLCNGKSDPDQEADAGYEVNMLFVRMNNLEVYSTLTKTQLDELLGVTA